MPAGYKVLIAWAGTTLARLMFEISGCYQAACELAFASAGLPGVKINRAGRAARKVRFHF
jgi:hypothetical protein